MLVAPDGSYSLRRTLLGRDFIGSDERSFIPDLEITTQQFRAYRALANCSLNGEQLAGQRRSSEAFSTRSKSVENYTLEVGNILRYIFAWLYYATY